MHGRAPDNDYESPSEKVGLKSMSSRIDEIMAALKSGTLTLDDACRAVAASVRQDPQSTRMWPMLVESRVTQQLITPAVGRALIDAMEAFEPEKTMWISPSGGNDEASPAQGTTGDVLRAPNSTTKPKPQPRFATAEELAAFLWNEPVDKNAPQDRQPTAVYSLLDAEAAAQSNQPRPMPGAAPALPAPELGAIIKNRYRLDKHMGFGGVGQVFSATDLELLARGHAHPYVTIKFVAVDLKHEPQALKSLQETVAATKLLKHPNIVRTFDIESEDDRVFVVMESLSGRWLGDQIRQVRKTGLPQDRAWPIIEGIAQGLSFAHSQGVVHSDLSPYSVFVTGAGIPKVMGFGLIHAVPTSNEAMDLLDTLTLHAYSEAYTADTWATHATPHPADDLYPLGVIAYELLTGRHPFNRHSLTTARQKNLSYEPIPNIKRRARNLIAHCLSFERAERPKDGARFVRRMQGPAVLRWIFGHRASVFVRAR